MKCNHRKHEFHGMSGTRIWGIWCNIRGRCSNPNRPKSHLYANKGIKVCDEWIASFQSFYDWSIANGYTEETTLDRIDGNKGYSPNNCRWTTKTIQSRNREPCIGTSKYYGISWNKSKAKWKAAIYINNKQKHIGYYSDELDAAKARDEYILNNNLTGFNLNQDYYKEDFS